MKHVITITYTEDQLKAQFDCPLCKQRWSFPFSAREIDGKPWPEPNQLVALHFYGCGPDAQYCSGFDPNVPLEIVDLDERTARVKISN